MQQAFIQQAVRTTTGTQDWTDVNVTVPKGLMCFSSLSTLNDTNSAGSLTSIGLCSIDGNNGGESCNAVDDATAAGSASSVSYFNNTIGLINYNTAFSPRVRAAYSATIANGIRINYTTAGASAWLTNGLLLGGNDFEIDVASGRFTSADTDITVTHNLSNTPDVVIMLSSSDNPAAMPAGARESGVSFWERVNGTQCGISHIIIPSVSPTSLFQIATTDFGHGLGTAGGDVWTFSLTNVNSASLTVHRSATGSSACNFIVITMRGKGATLAAKCGVFTTPTGTGSSTPITGMAAAPTVLLTVGTRLTSTGTVISTDAAGSWSIGVACNNGGVTEQGCVMSTNQDNVVTTVAKNQITQSQALSILDNTGAQAINATVSSWNSDGVTLNYGTANGTAQEVLYLAFGMGAAVAAPTAWLTA